MASFSSRSQAQKPSRRPGAARPPAGRRKALYSLLGDLPDRHRPIGGREIVAFLKTFL